jgi:carbonic anhydrase
VNQSPIDIVNPIEANLAPIRIQYQGSTTQVINNGHTLQVNVEAGSWLEAEGDRFQLLQFHFHSPSEHRVKSKLFPFEAHFVHADESGALAVVGVLFEEGAKKSIISAIEAAASEEEGSAPFEIGLDQVEFQPKSEPYFRYNGSLTTPPCSEGVRWYVLQSTATVTAEEVKIFIDRIGADARGAQPLNARIIAR